MLSAIGMASFSRRLSGLAVGQYQ